MRKFILKSLAFSVVTIICFICFWALVCSNRDQTLKLPNNCNIVFLGNSHIECAINDSIIKNSFNFARSGENLAYTYLKIKSLCQYNLIDTIIISYDNLIMQDSTYIQSMNSPYFFDQLNLKDYEHMIKYNIESFYSLVTYPFDWYKLIQIAKTDRIDQFSDMGGYRYNTRNKLQDNIKLLRNIKQCNVAEYTNLNIYFLCEIVKFCKKTM